MRRGRLAAGVFECLPPSLLVDRGGTVIAANAAARQACPDAAPGVRLAAAFPMAERAAIEAVLDAALRGAPAPRAAVTALPMREGDGSVRALLVQLPADVAGDEPALALAGLVGGVAHDVNNLLTIIATAAEAIAGAPEMAVAEAARIAAATRRGAALMDRLLAIGRQQTLKPVGVCVNAAVGAVVDLLRPTLGAQIAVVLEAELPGRNVWIDAGQFDQVLMNLLLNAGDAMPGGGRLVVVTGHATLVRPQPGFPDTVPPGRWVSVTVRDSGEGIAADVLPRIFDPYFTTRAGQPGARGGTGLGLATVHGIARQSGGFLAVRSTPGAGTEMTLFLPRWDGRVEAQIGEPAAEPHRGEGRSVLLVDDEELIRDPVARALEARGWHVVAAESGEAALDVLDRAPRSLAAVVSDIVMTGMDGLALVRAVRERAEDSRLPAILMSGYARPAQRAALAAMDAVFLRKPYSVQSLVEALGDLTGPAAKSVP